VRISDAYFQRFWLFFYSLVMRAHFVTHNRPPHTMPLTKALNGGNMRFIVILLLLFSSNLLSLEFTPYEDESKVYNILVPSSWQKSHPTGQKNIITFSPKEGGVELTLSLTQNLNLPPVFPEKYAALMFPNEKPITKAIRRNGKNWNSIRQDWAGLKGPFKTIWLAEFIGYKTNAIVITLSANEADIGNYKEPFEKMVGSLSFQ